MKQRIDTLKRTRDIWFSLTLFFFIAFAYFCFVANYVLYFQETQALFVFSGEFLSQRLAKPGGLVEYAGRFFTQFYASRVAGSLIVAFFLTLPAVSMCHINRKLIRGAEVSFPLMFVVPSLMMVMQSNYYHLMEYNIGFNLVMLFFLFAVSSAKPWRKAAVLLIFPLFWYVSGGYSLVFAGMYLVYILFAEKKNYSLIFAALLVAVTGITFLIFSRVLFLEPPANIVFYPLPFLENSAYIAAFAVLVVFIVLYSLISRIVTRTTTGKLKTLHYTVTAGLIVVIALFLALKAYNSQTARVVELERLVFAGKYDEAIKFQEKKPARNLIGQYFYNYSLAEAGKLCDRLFEGSQDFGYGSLILPWGDVHLSRGAYFYYAIGLTNEAHRWAYEEMIVYGYRPENIKMLAKTSLLNGDYQMAQKYVNILKKTVFYRKWASELEKMINDPALIQAHPEFGEKLKLIPSTNFFVQFNEPQNNLPLIIESHPGNKTALEYYLAGLLLSKNVEIAVDNIRKLRSLGYTRIPRYLEEAALIVYNSTGIAPDLGGLPLSAESSDRFSRYFTVYVAARQDQTRLKERMQKDFGDTFWYYFHFK
ncbi:MAG: DUF6057 family protein [Bacteroidales bacterium]|jgi:hypothetical protein|nr:DUF6057 family protein [Bacteroidales bacterium]